MRIENAAWVSTMASNQKNLVTDKKSQIWINISKIKQSGRASDRGNVHMYDVKRSENGSQVAHEADWWGHLPRVEILISRKPRFETQSDFWHVLM